MAGIGLEFQKTRPAEFQGALSGFWATCPLATFELQGIPLPPAIPSILRNSAILGFPAIQPNPAILATLAILPMLAHSAAHSGHSSHSSHSSYSSYSSHSRQGLGV